MWSIAREFGHSLRPITKMRSPLESSPEPIDLAATLADMPSTTLSKEDSSLARLSYAPATKTTVVTTTTTTTTTFPPFLMRAPKQLKKKDLEKYPLAASPTPQSIRRFRFDIDGQSTYFEEADDAHRVLFEYDQTQRSLQEHNGSFQSFMSSSSEDFKGTTSLATPHRHMKQSPKRRQISPEHSLTPLSSSESVNIHRCRPKTRKSHKVSSCCSSTNIPHPLRQDQSFLDPISDTDTVEDFSQSNDDESTNAQACSQTSPGMLPNATSSVHGPKRLRPNQLGPERVRHVHGSATPPIAESDLETFDATNSARVARRPVSIPTTLDTSPAQDASLPSPSLSPIAAASNLHRPVLPSSSTMAVEDMFQSPKSPVDYIPRSTTRPLDYDLRHRKQTALEPVPKEFEDDAQMTAPPSITDIPKMLDSFDALPDNFQTYVMYQLLRRCSKSTLHFVADVVEPTLKCDFLNRLPLELSLQVIRYLDAKSMCRAAQVSKKWRHLTNSDEIAWRNLLDTDGYVLPKGEIERAVREGWGWQYPSKKSGWEENISSKSDSINLKPSAVSDFYDAHDSSDDEASDVGKARRDSPTKKRKSLSKPLSLKKQKRYHSSKSRSLPSSWTATLRDALGPHAYANAAAAAVPNPKIGLPSLQSLHLFKSIYQRHHSIRLGWMDPATKPLHLAFRARQQNVVTCLQFDSEKVLTGSDDANIDIYDTRTGASMKQLEGHEGGVWALEYLGNILVSGSTDRSVRVWDMDEGKCLQVFQGHTSTVRCLQILKPVKVGETSDGSAIMMPKQPLIITGSRDSTCRIWKLPKLEDPRYLNNGVTGNDAENPYFVRTLTGHGHSVRAIAAHADTLVSGSYDASVRVWKISTGELLHRLQGHATRVYSVVLDHERKQCISGSMDNSVKVWSIETGACLFNLEGHTSLVGLLDLRDDTLVSAAADSTLRIWDPENGKCKHILSAHTGAITCFSHDGRKVISGSDRTLKMWNTRTGEWVRDLLTDLTGVWQIKFDERRCIAAVQRDDWTYIEVLDFGACRDGVSDEHRGRRIIVDSNGKEVIDSEDFIEPLRRELIATENA